MNNIKPEIHDKFKNKPNTRINFGIKPPRMFDKDMN